MSHDETALQARLEKLEELLAHQSRTLDDVSGELVKLRDAHEDLARRHKALVTRLQEFEDAADDTAPRYEKPPHY